MANTLGEDLTGKVVVIRLEYFRDDLKTEYAPEEMRRFRCDGGFGCHTYTSGSRIHGQWLADGEVCQIDSSMVEKIVE
jgi:hypothetical protein